MAISTCYLYSRDATEVAVSLSSNEVQILQRTGREWQSTETLSEVRDSRFLVMHIVQLTYLAAA